MAYETLDVDGLLDKRPYRAPPLTEEELLEKRAKASISIHNESNLTARIAKLALGGATDQAATGKLYIFIGRQTCELGLELMQRYQNVAEYIITVDTGEKLNLSYISATKRNEGVHTKKIEMLLAVASDKIQFLLYPEEIPDYLCEPLLSRVSLQAYREIITVQNRPPKGQSHSLTLFGSDINEELGDGDSGVEEAALSFLGPEEIYTSKSKLVPLSKTFAITNQEPGLVKSAKTKISDKTSTYTYLLTEEAGGLPSLSAFEYLIRAEFSHLHDSESGEILRSLRRKFDESYVRIYT